MKLDISKEKWQELKKAADQILGKEGNIKQEVLNTHINYIEMKEGKEGVEKIEKVLNEIGVPLNFDEIDPLEWTKESYSSLCIIAAKIVFNWTEEDVFEMGAYAPKTSFIFKMFFKYFASPEKLFEKTNEYWKKHYDFASLEPVEFNSEEKYAVLRIKGFKMHPLLCIFQSGYIKSIAELAIDTEKVSIKETKCMFDGDPYHEFVLTYE